MSARALSWAWEQDLPASEKIVLLALADQAGVDFVVRYGPQADLAAMTGAAERTVRGNLRKLEDRGLIRREAQFEGGYRVPDLVALLRSGAPADDAGGSSGRALPSSSSPKKMVKKDDVTGSDCRWPNVPEEMQADAAELLRRKTKVAERIVTPAEMECAASALAEFNRQAESDFGLGANMRAIVMRIRERPSMDSAKHVRLVQSAFRLKWWERSGRGRRATPAVIYGNERVFEQVVQDAVDEANGKRRDGQAAAKTKRYTRED